MNVFTANWKAAHMNHRTDDLLFPPPSATLRVSITHGVSEAFALSTSLFGILGQVKTKLQLLDNIKNTTIPDGVS